MKKNLLIAQLQAIKGNPEIALIDVRKMNAADEGEGTSVGIYPSFMVALMSGEAIPEGHDPWIALQFTPDEIDDITYQFGQPESIVLGGEELEMFDNEDDRTDPVFGLTKPKRGK